MHDYIFIQSTQLFCKAVVSYPSGGVWYHGSRRWPLILRAGFRYHGILSPPLPFPAKTSTAWHCDGHSDQDARLG